MSHFLSFFRVHNKQTKLSENNLEIVCGVRSMMNDTPSTGKSTLSCNISITHTHTHPHTPPTPPHTHTKQKQKQNKNKKTIKQTEQPIYLHIMENNFEIVRGVRPIKNDTPSTGKTNLCHNILITQPTKISVCMENCFYAKRPSACARRSRGSRGLAPGGGCKGVAPPKFGIW